MPVAAIETLDYEHDTQKLLIVFRTGRQYVYRHVPLETWVGLMNAWSREDFYDVYIRGHFAFVRCPHSVSFYDGQMPRALAEHEFHR